MPAALDVNKEAVQVLVGAVGVREAARRMDLSENTVLAWANRGNWVRPGAVGSAIKVQSKVQSPAIKPADALQEALAEGITATKVGFTRYAARMAKQAGDAGLLEEAPLYKAVADIHGKMHPEVAEDHSTHLSFFSVSMDRPGDGPSDPVEHAIDVTPVQPPDDY